MSLEPQPSAATYVGRNPRQPQAPQPSGGKPGVRAPAEHEPTSNSGRFRAGPTRVRPSAAATA